MTAASRILLIRPSALGDVCRTAPVLASLRAAHPEARIDWLVQDTFAEAVVHHPALTRVLPFPRRPLGTALRRMNVAPLMDFLDGLATAHYDLVVDVQGLARSGFFAYWTGAPRRLGLADARELGWLGLTERHRVDARLHTVDRMLEVLRCAGFAVVPDMRLYASDTIRQQMRSIGHVMDGPYAVVAPTSRWPAKRWPAERFAEVAKRIAASGVPVVIVGGASERDQCGPLIELARQTPGVLDMIGQTSVGQLMALIESSALVLANDSAALHMAVGFDRPLVALYGPTRVDLVGPYQRDADVIQHLRPGDVLDHKHERGVALMERITVEEVAAAVEARLAGL